MSPLRPLATAVMVFFMAPSLSNSAPRNPVPQDSEFQTKAALSVDKETYTLSSAVAMHEARKYPPGYSWVRIHFYPFPLGSEDIAAARAGNVEFLDKQANKNFYDPKVRNHAFGVIQLSVDKDFKVWQVDMSVPGHGCTIAPFEKDVAAFLEAFRYDGTSLRLKSKGSHVCDLRSVGAGEQTFTWDFDVSLPVFEQAQTKKYPR